MLVSDQGAARPCQEVGEDENENIHALFVFLVIIFVGIRFGSMPWTPARIAGVVIGLPSAVLLVLARIELGGSFSVRPKAQILVTHGLYSRIRNPIYPFGGLAIAGALLYINNAGDFLQRLRISDLVVSGTIESSSPRGLQIVNGETLNANTARLRVDRVFPGKTTEELQFSWYTTHWDGARGYGYSGPPLADSQTRKRYSVFLTPASQRSSQIHFAFVARPTLAKSDWQSPYDMQNGSRSFEREQAISTRFPECCKS
jgi:hypothetical protein